MSGFFLMVLAAFLKDLPCNVYFDLEQHTVF